MQTLTRLLWAVPLAFSSLYLLYRFAKWIEKKNFNNGKCKCGGNLRPFDARVFLGSDGSRGYSCDKCDKSVFCSYNVDKAYRYMMGK